MFGLQFNALTATFPAMHTSRDYRPTTNTCRCEPNPLHPTRSKVPNECRTKLPPSWCAAQTSNLKPFEGRGVRALCPISCERFLRGHGLTVIGLRIFKFQGWF